MKKLGMLLTALLLLLLLPLNAWAEELLVPVGKIVGLQLRNDTVTVAAFDDAMGSLARDAGLRNGDEILKAGERTVRTPADVRAALEECGGSITLTVRRGSKQSTLEITPRKTSDGYRLGVFLRQGIAGIGTVTWYDPETGKFGALGHGVNEPGGCLLKMTEGNTYDAEILSVKKGKAGCPGQLKGSADAGSVCGNLYRNSPQGVFGVTREQWEGTPVPTAALSDLHTGTASIRSTVTGSAPRDYSVEILKIYPSGRTDGRDLLLKITDPALLETTGGIVQGMSGSPIIQDGKLVGAVTHVLVGDPTMGYGIYIGNMLDAAA